MICGVRSSVHAGSSSSTGSLDAVRRVRRLSPPPTPAPPMVTVMAMLVAMSLAWGSARGRAVLSLINK
jgi:hypothetical protein